MSPHGRAGAHLAAGTALHLRRAGTLSALFGPVVDAEVDLFDHIDGGWAVARATLGNERISIGAGDVSSINESAGRLVAVPTEHRAGDRAVEAQVGRLVAEGHALRVIRFRELSGAVSGTDPSPIGNITKLLDAEGSQRVARVGFELVAEGGSVLDAATLTWMRARSRTIAGGTSEISRNQIAERLLGLPRDPLLS